MIKISLNKAFFLMSLLCFNNHATETVQEEIEIPHFEQIAHFDNPNLTLFSDTNFLVVYRISQAKIFSINGTHFNYDDIFKNNEKRYLFWHQNEQKDRSGYLFDLKTKESIKTTGYTP